MGTSVKLRQQVLARCNGYCESCGATLPDNFALHHRKLRSQGGKDVLSNLLALHHECHNLGRPSAHLDVAWATERGLLVPSWSESVSHPLTLPNGAKVLLDDNGGMTLLPYDEGEGNGKFSDGDRIGSGW